MQMRNSAGQNSSDNVCRFLDKTIPRDLKFLDCLSVWPSSEIFISHGICDKNHEAQVSTKVPVCFSLLSKLIWRESTKTSNFISSKLIFYFLFT